MEKVCIELPSEDKYARLHVVWFKPDKGSEVKGLIQICHGMTEYIERYEQLAAYFTQRGYIVFGNDVISHGRSTTTQSEGLYFADWFDVVTDAVHVREYAQKTYPDLPIYLIGFSLGSFVVRSMQDIRAYEKEILVGTGNQPAFVLQAMRKLLSVKFAKSMNVPSDEVRKMAFDSYNKKFAGKESDYWLITDDARRAQYHSDAMVCQDMTPGFFCEFLKGMAYTAKQLKHPNNTIPTLFLYGENDPVGDFGKGVCKVFDAYKKNNAQTSIESLHGAHDILHDAMCEQAFERIYKFIED